MESSVKYVKRDFHYACSYSDLQDLNVQARQWCDKVANCKVHGTTGEVPFERLSQERQYLQPVRVKQPLFIVETRKATKTQLISIDGNKYSVPVQFARKRVKYRRLWTGSSFWRMISWWTQFNWRQARGKNIIQDRHYPAHSRAKRVSHPLQVKFEELAPSARAYLQGLSRSRSGHLRDQMEKIISLADTYSGDELEAAMKRGIAFKAFGYSQLKRTVEKQRRESSVPACSAQGCIDHACSLHKHTKRRSRAA
ncbi:MAG: hypothetical protein RJR35_05425 [Thermoanaerobacterales bacterium]|nr:hypothetical protein [Thermoanaerobacterales bacterium]